MQSKVFIWSPVISLSWVDEMGDLARQMYLEFAKNSTREETAAEAERTLEWCRAPTSQVFSWVVHWFMKMKKPKDGERITWKDQKEQTQKLVVFSRFSHVHLSATLRTAAHQAPPPWDSSGKNMEWVAMPSSRGSSRLRDWACVSCFSCTGRQVLYASASLDVYTTSVTVTVPTSQSANPHKSWNEYLREVLPS